MPLERGEAGNAGESVELQPINQNGNHNQEEQDQVEWPDSKEIKLLMWTGHSVKVPTNLANMAAGTTKKSLSGLGPLDWTWEHLRQSLASAQMGLFLGWGGTQSDQIF